MIEPFIETLKEYKEYDLLSSLLFVNKEYYSRISRFNLGVIEICNQNDYDKWKYLNCSFDINFQIYYLNYKNIVGLNLCGNNFIEDIIMLTNLTKLNLCDNSTIKNISMLMNLTELCLVGNNTIKDINMLTNLTYLDIDFNDSIKDTNMLTNLTSSNLKENNTIKDISMLINLTSLNLY